jgi:A/G-specific adenine glycosylase
MLPKWKPRELASFQGRLLRWFRTHRRDLPWRRSRDPYRIWLSEIMLQQTRVAAVVPYYERFLRRFPTVRSLASAPLDAVLKHWAGLGYYSRARNLHAAAKQIVAQHSGRFPADYDTALALPGIGRYTASAILSIAYGAPLAVLDGNVARVLARLGAVRGDLRKPKRWRTLEVTAQTLLASRHPGDWNQAMMELGATVCLPRAPHCDACPAARCCRAFQMGIAEELPSKRLKRAPVKVQIAAAILLDARDRTLLVKEPGKHDGVLFSRMWQFPAVEAARDPATDLSRHLQASLGLRNDGIFPLPHARHSVTFRSVTLHPFLVRENRLPECDGVRTVSLAAVPRLAVSSATKKLAAAALAFLDQSPKST